MVVAERAVAARQGLQHLPAIDGVFERKTHVRAGVRVLVHLHDQQGVPAAGRAHDFDARRLGEKADGLVIDAVDNVDLTRHQRVQASGGVVDDRNVSAVQKTAPLLPVIGSLLEEDPDAWVELFQGEGSGSNRFRPVLEVGRNHEDVIVGQRVRKVEFRGVERELNLAPCRAF